MNIFDKMLYFSSENIFDKMLYFQKGEKGERTINSLLNGQEWVVPSGEIVNAKS